MISDAVKRLKQEGQWEYFLRAFNKMKDEVVADMRHGNVKTMEDLVAANAKLEILDKVIGIEGYAEKWGSGNF